LKRFNPKSPDAFIFFNWPITSKVDYKKRQFYLERIKILKHEKYFKNLTAKQRAKRYGCSEGHYNYLLRKHELRRNEK